MTDIIVIIDESSSMDCMGNEPKDATNNFINEQKGSGGDSKLSLYTFSDKVRCVIDEKPIKDVESFTDYKPNGMTALYDAIGTAITKKLASPGSSKVVCVIITDGLENASQEFRDISPLIKKAETEHDWKFIYIGANQDVFSVGQGIGFKPKMCAAYDQTACGGLETLARAVSSQVSKYRTGETPEMDIQQYSTPVRPSSPTRAASFQPLARGISSSPLTRTLTGAHA